LPRALVIQAADDRTRVTAEVVPTLAMHGFAVEYFDADPSEPGRSTNTTAPSWANSFDLVAVVVSKSAHTCASICTCVEGLLQHKTMVLPILFDATSPGSIHKGLDGLLHVDLRIDGTAARQHLADVLPRTVGAEPVDVSGWSEDHFQEQLERAVRTFQFAQTSDLMNTATEQILRRNIEYTAEGANKVLQLLSEHRHWRLIRRFTETLIEVQGMRDPLVLQSHECAVHEQQATELANAAASESTCETVKDGDHTTARIAILMRVNDPEWIPRHIPDLRVTSQMGILVAGTCSRISFSALQHDRRILSVERSRPVAVPECDRSIPFVRGHAVHTGDLAERGDQAIVAVIEDGIDPRHAAFQDEDGNSRILAVWDQRDGSGSPPRGFDEGTEYRELEMARFVAEGRLPESWSPGRHGTHVTSIAAGRAVADRFAGGMAPQAKILVVIPRIETGGYSFTYTNALRYIERVSAERDLPVVVNISFGENTGAHDGSSHLESAVDAFTKGGWAPGRVVVTSAGNERCRNTHARIALLSHMTHILKWETHQLPQRDDELELWFSAADELRFRLRNPAGIWTAPVDRQTPCLEGVFDDRNGYRLELTPACPGNRDSRLSVRILARQIRDVRLQNWQLEITCGRLNGTGILHAWIRSFKIPLMQFTNHRDDSMTLTVPGTAHSVISVGAIEPGEPLYVGDLSSFGPTRDQRRKPEVCAPGINIIAARHNSIGGIAAMSGTSMAAPHVAGAVALLLSRMQKSGRPQVNALQVREALCQRAWGNQNGWDRGKGHGVLDAEALLRAF